MVILAGPNGGGKSRLLGILSSACQEPQQRARNGVTPSDFGETSFSPGIQAVQLTVLQPLTVPTGNRNSGDHGIFTNDQNAAFTGAMWDVSGYFRGVARALFNHKHPDFASDENTKLTGNRALAVQKELRALTGFELSYVLQNQDPTPTIDGVAMDLDKFSPGQMILLSWYISLETQKRHPSQKPIVIAVDEIENHLHPSAAIDAVSRLRDNLGGSGQIWLATHSPALLAAFAHEASVYHVSRSGIEYSSSNLTRVVDGLVGGADGRLRLRDILDDAERVAFLSFAAQCLQGALVAGVASESDQQSMQLGTHLKRCIAEKRKMRILDYASGQGRFAAELARNLNQSQQSQIDYLAYDQNEFDSDNHRHIRAENLAKLYPKEDVNARMLSSLADLGSSGRSVGSIAA